MTGPWKETMDTITINVYQQDNGLWDAELVELDIGVAYCVTREDAIAHAKSMALKVLAENLLKDEPMPDGFDPFVVIDKTTVITETPASVSLSSPFQTIEIGCYVDPEAGSLVVKLAGGRDGTPRIVIERHHPTAPGENIYLELSEEAASRLTCIITALIDDLQECTMPPEMARSLEAVCAARKAWFDRLGATP